MQKIYIGLGVLAVGAAVLIGVNVMKPGNPPVPANSELPAGDERKPGQVNAPAGQIANPSGSYSINELFTMNKPLKCTWKESATGAAEVSNIIYIDGKKFYQDVTMGDAGHAFTVSDGEYLYIWNDFTPAASKMKITETKTDPEAGKQNANGAAAMEQKRDFICENWAADASVFNLPQGKNFRDITADMEQAVQEFQGGGAENAKQRMCDMCLQAPTEELKNNCLAGAQCAQ